MSQRTDRLDSQIRQELMDLLQREMKDPRIGFATITRVETARDLGHARVWVSVYGTDEERERSMSALHDAAPWLRRRLSERLHIRHVPELSLRADDSIEAGDRVLRLLRSLELGSEGAAGTGASDADDGVNGTDTADGERGA
jgi:ribosome-binding factor A